MELCREVIDGLLLLNSNKINDKQMETILNECKQLLLQQNSHQLNESLITIEEKLLKLSICSLIIECVKWNSNYDTIRNIFEENGINSNQNCLKLIEFYRNIRSELRSILSQQTISSLPLIIDCHWSQYYVIKSQNRDKINEINYLIGFNCDKNVRIDSNDSNDTNDCNNTSNDFMFSANLQELQDLCSKLRECRKVVEKIIK